jgi:hypothetical protein
MTKKLVYGQEFFSPDAVKNLRKRDFADILALHLSVMIKSLIMGEDSFPEGDPIWETLVIKLDKNMADDWLVLHSEIQKREPITVEAEVNRLLGQDHV